VLSFIDEVIVNFKGIFGTVTNGKYQIIDKHVLKFFEDIVLRPGTTTSLVNIFVEGVMMKEKPNLVSHDLNFYILVVKSSFIDICDSFDENGPSLPDVVVHLCMNSRHVK
jgi:hypothetical protein